MICKLDPLQLSTDTVLQTFPDWKETPAVSLWSEHGAVILIVRRPGWFLCREVSSRGSNLVVLITWFSLPLYAKPSQMHLWLLGSKFLKIWPICATFTRDHHQLFRLCAGSLMARLQSFTNGQCEVTRSFTRKVWGGRICWVLSTWDSSFWWKGKVPR